MLLSVIDLIAQGRIKFNQIHISDELIENFKRYWKILGSESFKSSDFALPFFHLKNTKNKKHKFWYLKFSSQYDGGRPQTIPQLREDVEYAYVDDELFELLIDENFRKELIDALVAAWFTSSKKEIGDILNIHQNFHNLTLKAAEKKDKYNDNEPRFNIKKSVVRNAFFRKAVVHIYDYRCAFCRLKVTNSLTQNIVDGSHIKPLAKFFDSRIDNGISFCKNHHWAFDHGLFSIDDDYKIIISSDLQEESPYARPMIAFNDEMILLPSYEKYFPRIEAIQWHRKNVFRS